MASLVRILAVIAASIVAVSFIFFAVDQMTEGSENQVRNLQDDGTKARSDVVIDQPSPPARIERIREQSHSSARELIDDGNDVLVAPFAEIVKSNNPWVQRLVPLAIGLVLYGLLGMLLANALPSGRREVTDWREAHG